MGCPPLTTPLTPTDPSLVGIPGLGISAFPSSPGPPHSVGEGEMREREAGHGHPPQAPMVGPAAPAAAPASLAPGLMEIRAVALRKVAIKGVHSGLYLCMGADGRMLGLVGAARGRAGGAWPGASGPAGQGRGAGPEPRLLASSRSRAHSAEGVGGCLAARAGSSERPAPLGGSLGSQPAVQRRENGSKPPLHVQWSQRPPRPLAVCDSTGKPAAGLCRLGLLSGGPRIGPPPLPAESFKNKRKFGSFTKGHSPNNSGESDI